MTVSWIEIRDFRNIRNILFEPDPTGITAVLGSNGAGKTSILEAIAYCSTLRSFRTSNREALINQGADSAVLRAETEERSRRGLIELEIGHGRRDRVLCNKTATRDGEALLEFLRVVVFTPEDLVIVQGAPGDRRRFLDDILVTATPQTAGLVRAVDRILRQRGALLQQTGRIDSGSREVHNTLDVWDEQLARKGEALSTERDALLRGIGEIAATLLCELTGQATELVVSYRRSGEGDLAKALAAARQTDLRRGVTTVGPHRDDVEITVDGLDGRSRLSQGRQRGVALALRLGGYEMLARRSNSAPVLLLDDAFSELDPQTTERLLHLLPKTQTLLTTASVLPPGLPLARTAVIKGGRIEP